MPPPPTPHPTMQTNRTPVLLVGSAAALLLTVSALRRMVEISASRAEERVMRQLELQKRAEELSSVRNVSVRDDDCWPWLVPWLS